VDEVRRALRWRPVRVTRVQRETDTAVSLVLDEDGWPGHVAGQHVDLRLTAADGYRASRSYSLSSAPGEAPQVTVELVDDGEVSPFLTQEVMAGDKLEVRGPVGGWFVWRPVDGDRVLLVGGGSGIAPLRAMWRTRTAANRVGVLYSAQTAARVMFGGELAADDLWVRTHLTREATPDTTPGRIDAVALKEALAAVDPLTTYVCGPTAFVEAITAEVRGLGVDPRAIRAERFG
jgi:ferredoxin-NADP reductase